MSFLKMALSKGTQKDAIVKSLNAWKNIVSAFKRVLLAISIANASTARILKAVTKEDAS